MINRRPTACSQVGELKYKWTTKERTKEWSSQSAKFILWPFLMNLVSIFKVASWADHFLREISLFKRALKFLSGSRFGRSPADNWRMWMPPRTSKTLGMPRREWTKSSKKLAGYRSFQRPLLKWMQIIIFSHSVAIIVRSSPHSELSLLIFDLDFRTCRTFGHCWLLGGSIKAVPIVCRF